MNLTAWIENGYIRKISDGVKPSEIDIKIPSNTSLELIQEINDDLINGVSKRFKLVGSKIIEETLEVEEVTDIAVVLKKELDLTKQALMEMSSRFEEVTEVTNNAIFELADLVISNMGGGE